MSQPINGFLPQGKIIYNVEEIQRFNQEFPRDFIRLHKNENPMVIDKLTLYRIGRILRKELVYQYHDLKEIYEVIQKKYSLNLENFILTAGSDLGLKAIYELFTSENSSVLVPEYRYAMHDVYTKLNGTKLIEYTLDGESGTTVNNILIKLDKKIDILFIESPNGTSGEILSQDDLENLSRKCKDNNCLLVIDECYAQIKNNYLEVSAFDNVLSLRSFSKNLGLAGVRAGMVVGHSNFLDFLHKIKPMHEISSFTAEVLKIVLKKDPTRIRSRILRNTHLLCKFLSKNAIIYKTTNANFILLKESKNRNSLHEYLLENKIVIPKQVKTGYLKDFYRISIGKKKDIKRLIQMLRKY